MEILGRTFTLKGSIAPDSLQDVARKVDEQLRQLQRSFPASPLADVAILAALNLAYECLEIKEDYRLFQADIEERSRLLIEMLETHDAYFPPGP